jgi:osmotically-inducible protein OsmY
MSARGAALGGEAPIQAWEESDRGVSARTDTELRAQPTARAARATYDGSYDSKEASMNANSLRAAIVAAFCAAGLAACHQQATSDTVGQKVDKTIDVAKDKLAAAGDEAQRKLDEAGDKAKQEINSIGSRVELASNDTAITASIKTDFLKDPDLSVLKIDVDTQAGVVTLNGLADNESSRRRAETMASAVKGVKEVRNYLVVKRA